MNRYAIVHKSGKDFAYAISENTINVRLKTKKDDVDRITVHYMNVYDHSDNRKKTEMKKILSDDLFDMYEASLKMEQKHFKYFFEIESKDELIYYTSDGFMQKDVVNENSFFYPVINDDEIFDMPKWAEGAMVYQIFVDRFNSTKDKDFVNAQWDELPKRHHFYGGDFDGITEKLDYIKSLGTDILYLSPVFESDTNHKYDIKDYYAIDENLGGEDKLKQLIDAVHDKGMKIVIDGVFNHMSSDNEIFQDVVKKGEKSQYKDFFYIYSYPVDTKEGNYDTFAGCVPAMPRINTSNPEAIDYLVKSAVYWTKKLNPDGWRLDVADEISSSFWRQFNREIKKVNKDALLIGEVWNDASKWVDSDMLHTSTNYKFRKWLLDFINEKIDSDAYRDNVSSNAMLYKTPVYGYLINLLGSHDTKRLANVIGKEKAKLALLMSIGVKGISLMYYGDETGLEGSDDPDNRRTMPWDKLTYEQIAPFIQMNQLRKKYPQLRYGDMKILKTHKKLISFNRTMSGQQEIIEIHTNFFDNPITIQKKKALFTYNAATKKIQNNIGIDRIEPMSFAVCINEKFEEEIK